MALGENRKTPSGPKQGWNLRPYDFWLGNSTTETCEDTAIISIRVENAALCSWFSRDVTGAVLVYRTVAKEDLQGI